MQLPYAFSFSQLPSNRIQQAPARGSSSIYRRAAPFWESVHRQNQSMGQQKTAVVEPDYFEAGYLLVPDKRAQAHLRFWAACSQEVSTMPELLFKAISQVFCSLASKSRTLAGSNQRRSLTWIAWWGSLLAFWSLLLHIPLLGL